MASTVTSTQVGLSLHLQDGVLNCSPMSMGHPTWMIPSLAKTTITRAQTSSPPSLPWPHSHWLVPFPIYPHHLLGSHWYFCSKLQCHFDSSKLLNSFCYFPSRCFMAAPFLLHPHTAIPAQLLPTLRLEYFKSFLASGITCHKSSNL